MKEKNVDYFGHDIKLKVTPNDGACAGWCLKTPGCTHWSWHIPIDGYGSRCFLKTSDAGRTRRKKKYGMISGNRQCAIGSDLGVRVTTPAAAAAPDRGPYLKSPEQGTKKYLSRYKKLFKFAGCVKEKNVDYCLLYTSDAADE